jgi:hypothetical protein
LLQQLALLLGVDFNNESVEHLGKEERKRGREEEKKTCRMIVF